MKKFLLSLGIAFLSVTIFGQNQFDALRYSDLSIGGTARSVGMGGAFGALGGDFYSLSQNPAGIAVYRKGEFTFTPELYLDMSSSNYFGREELGYKLNFNFSNLGYVMVFDEEKGPIKSVSFGLGFNRLANFHQNTNIEGVNPYTSLGDYMAGLANDYGLESFTSGLFYDGYIIDSLNNEFFLTNDYFNSFGDFRDVRQRYEIRERGKINEWVISIGMNIEDIVYLGTTIGIHSLQYRYSSNSIEYDAADLDYRYFDYYEERDVTGIGYTMKFGAIIKPVPVLRLGAAFHLPVVYVLDEEYDAQIRTQYVLGAILPVEQDMFGSWFEIDYGETDYKIKTPSRFTFGMGLVLGKSLILSGDVDLVNYSRMRYLSGDIYYGDINDDIDQNFKSVVNVKTGVELRMGPAYFRGGLGYYQNPVKSTTYYTPSDKYSFSAGFGIRAQDSFFDLTYQLVTWKEEDIRYSVNVNGTTYEPTSSSTVYTNRIMGTIGFRF